MQLTALEQDARRTRRVRQTLTRLGLSAVLRTADCRAVDQWWDGVPFDAILADVPCSASGSSAVIPTANGCAGKTTSSRSPVSSARFSTRCGRPWPPAGAALRDLLGLSGGEQPPGGGFRRRAAAGDPGRRRTAAALAGS